MTTLRELREENGKSRAEIAAALGVAYQTFARYENGLRRISLEQVLILSKQGSYAWFVWKKGYNGKTTIDWL